MKRRGGIAAVAWAALLLSGCGSQARLAVESTGRVPAEGGYELVGGQHPDDFAARLAERLRAHGITAGGTSPVHVVQTARSRRGAASGIILPGAEQAARPTGCRRGCDWLTLSVTIVDRRTGAEHFRGSAHKMVRRQSGNEAWPELIDALLPIDPASPGTLPGAGAM